MGSVAAGGPTGGAAGTAACAARYRADEEVAAVDESGEPTVDGALLDDARRLQPTVVEVRREIHRHPELGLELPGTQAVVLEALAGLGLDVQVGERTTSVVAVLEEGARAHDPAAGRHGRAAAAPRTPAWTSPREVEGAMHACGHDAHVAMLVGAARLLFVAAASWPAGWCSCSSRARSGAAAPR